MKCRTKHIIKSLKWKQCAIVVLALVVCIGAYIMYLEHTTTPTHKKAPAPKPKTTTINELKINYDTPSISSKKYSKIFCDNNDIQLIAAESYGISQIFRNRDEFEVLPELMEINSCALYKVNDLTHSLPYLVPLARVLLDDIAILFQQKVKEKYPNSNYRIIVTSLLRTQEDIRRLRRRNRNATENSCHRFGTTFDIAYRSFDKIEGKDIDIPTLNYILAETLYELRLHGRCFVKYERRQRCFHITVRSANIKYKTISEYINIVNKYAKAEYGKNNYTSADTAQMQYATMAPIENTNAPEKKKTKEKKYSNTSAMPTYKSPQEYKDEYYNSNGPIF